MYGPDSDSKNGSNPILVSGVNHYLYGIPLFRKTFSIEDFAVKVRLSIVLVRVIEVDIFIQNK